jgi:cytoskeletal protein CcmA (bactofilin family)
MRISETIAIMSTFGKSLVLRGELRSDDDLTVEGRVVGPITCETASIVVGASADVKGNVIARDITVFGRLAGQLIATEIVDIRPRADVSGQVISSRFVLDEAARFNGRVAPQQLEAALRVARFHQKQRDADAP